MWQAHPVMIYKLLPTAVWRAAQAAGRFDGSEVDLADGFVHVTEALVALARHNGGEEVGRVG